MEERLEEELMEDLAYEEAEGAADIFDEEDAFEDYDAADQDMFEEDEWEGGDEDYFDEEFGEEGFEELEDYADEYEDYGDEMDEEEEDEFDSAMAYALGAEDADEFFKKLWGGIKKFAKKAKRGIGKVARVAAPFAKYLPGPYGALASKGLGLLGKLRAEGATEEEALEAFAELAAYDEAAIPIVAGLAARALVKGRGARMSYPARKKLVKGMKKAAKTLVRKKGPKAVRALPKIVKSVKRTAAVRRTPVRVMPKIVTRTAAKVAKSPKLTKKLSRPSPKAKRIIKRVVGKKMARSYLLKGPVRISISGSA
ncbi:MAG: hypothetical protein MRJ65_11965 [Candidatus Brocadiaceae bacterium]|nr:hypothetical protein [Candidatus Brocadiaceae bacterium]